MDKNCDDEETKDNGSKSERINNRVNNSNQLLNQLVTSIGSSPS